MMMLAIVMKMTVTCSLSSPHLRGLARRLSSGHGQDIDTYIVKLAVRLDNIFIDYYKEDFIILCIYISHIMLCSSSYIER